MGEGLDRRDRPRVIVGTVAIALVLGASRWGTNLGVSPLFVTDVLIGLALVNWWLISRMAGTVGDKDPRFTSRPSLLFIVFFLFVVIRFLLSLGNGPAFDWIRDGTPYLYGFLAFVSAASIARSTPEIRHRTMKVFWWALGFHLLWMIAAVVGPLGQDGIAVPGLRAPLFQVRPDIDAAFLALLAGLCLRQIIVKRQWFWPILGIAGSSFVVLSLNSRAGLLSLAIALVVATFLGYSAIKQQTGRRLLLQMLVPLVVGAALVILPSTAPGARLIATINPATASSNAQFQAQGTQRAREATWERIIEWTNEDVGRQIVGSGFGNDFLTESGTIYNLQGTTYDGVRSPHNWFVANYARLGLIGFGLSAAVCLSLLFRMVKWRQKIGDDGLLSMAALTIVVILPVATLGVVLEAPHGAVPFFWAAGIVFAAATPKPPRYTDRRVKVELVGNQLPSKQPSGT
jgi:O-antigen ligase